jgi:IS5 family transposase
MAIIIKPPVSGGGGGAVDSVNGETGVVVLTTDNIDAGVNADRQYFTAALQTDLDAKADQTALDAVQDKTLYSNSYYVNDGVNDIQAILDDIAGSTGVSAIYVSAGSYGGSTVTISDHANVNILAPESPTGVHGCELLSRGLTISGASTTRIKIENLNIEGAFLINGTQGRHYFKNVIFDSTVTINNSTANFVTFEQCSFAGGISIASNVTATIYFDRCALGNQFVTSSRSGAGSPLLTILTECSGVNALQANLTSNVVLVGRTGFNSGSVVQYQNSDSYVYDLNNGLSTSFSGSYSELRNKPAIPTSSDDLTEGSSNLYYTNTRFDNRLATKTTDNLTEGSTNLYFTTARAKAAVVVNSMADNQTDQAPSVSSVKSYYTAGTGISLSSGQISSTITQYTDADADARITLQKGANNGICELDANGLVPTNHLPPLAITDVHVVADEAARLALIAQEGDVAIQTDDSSSWIYDGSAWVAFGVSGAVLSVNSQTGTVSLDTDDIPEGSTNKYFSDTLARTAAVVNSTDNNETNQAASVAAMKSYVLANAGAVNSVNSVSPVAGNVSLTTDNLTEGSSNLYYTNTRFDNRLGTKTTDNLSEGSTNLYYTSTRVNSAFDTRLATKTTDNLTEGATNKYFSDTLARNAFSAGTGITITTGQIATTITQYTDTLAKTAAVVNSMADNQTDQAPSVLSVKSYYTAGTGISITGGQISATSSGASRAIYSTEASFPLTISAPASSVIKRKYYLNNGASAATVNLPAVAGCDGLEIVLKKLGSGTVTVDASGSETIDGSLTLTLSQQYASVTLTATSSGWYIE